ncbi:MAG: diguanylate cyclase [Terracidiphilus sp.]|jgi:PAS domain S-box-containing protein
MTDRIELLEAALDSMPDGVGLFGGEGEVMFWNQAAQGITGYTAVELLGRPIPEGLEPLLANGNGIEQPPGNPPESHRSVARARHKLGHFVPVIANKLILINGLGERIGAAVLFHPVESQDALPQSEGSDVSCTEGARADLLERLQIEYDDFARGGAPLGILRISVDQAQELRKTHGVAACQAMLEKVYYALAHGLRPGEEIGYWANDGFLVIAHERSAEMLAAHAQTLAGLARTADFRWWGDRVSLTVSIGAAQVGIDLAESLTQLLRRARDAMESSIREGGNRATTAAGSSVSNHAQEDSPCSPS